jgi:flagellar hook-associated protein 3 FlgL
LITNVNPASQIFLAGVDQIQQRIAHANQQVTSGLRISVASDSPDQIGALLQLRANEQQNVQMQSNLGLELTSAQTADSTLGAASQVLNSATQLGAEGASSTSTADTRQTLGQQVQALLSQMVSISQTQVQGRYIFSGDDDKNPAYQLNLAAPTGVDTLSTATSTRQIQNPEGGTFQPSQTAQQIFDARNPDGTVAPGNVFAALNSLRTALQNNDQAGITAAQNSLQQASTHLNDSQSFYGNVENQIQAATSFAATYSTQLQSQIGGIQDADITASALELTEAGTQLQAAFQSQAKMPTSSLFSYLG